MVFQQVTKVEQGRRIRYSLASQIEAAELDEPAAPDNVVRLADTPKKQDS